MLTELPTMLTVLEENHQLEYSESYTGNVHGDATIEEYHYTMALERAFESFILTVEYTAVGIIYCADKQCFAIALYSICYNGITMY